MASNVLDFIDTYKGTSQNDIAAMVAITLNKYDPDLLNKLFTSTTRPNFKVELAYKIASNEAIDLEHTWVNDVKNIFGGDFDTSSYDNAFLNVLRKVFTLGF